MCVLKHGKCLVDKEAMKENVEKKLWVVERKKTRPDTRLPKSRAGGQGPYLSSPDHLGRSSNAKNAFNA